MKLKENPIDFVVMESSLLGKKGDIYSYYYLVKRDLDAFSAFEIITKHLKIDIKNIKYAGLKDKKAFTTQIISIPKKYSNKKNIKTKKITLRYIGDYAEPMFLGNLEHNKFIITIRNLNKNQISLIKNNENKIMKIKNYFDEQRFSKKNIEIGKAIIKKEFEKAIRLTEMKILDKDYLKHLRKIPKKQLKLYIHAYQSYLWNKAIENMEEKELDLFGFGINKKHVEYYQDIIKEENISERDFIIRQLPDMSSEGAKRNVFVDFKYKIINISKDTATIIFNLGKGSYATMMIKEFINCNQIV